MHTHTLLHDGLAIGVYTAGLLYGAVRINIYIYTSTMAGRKHEVVHTLEKMEKKSNTVCHMPQ